MTRKLTTGTYSVKRYRCTRCGYERCIGTNHWGECYPTCPHCSWKHPREPQAVHECLEPCPSTHDKPEPWKFVTLGDIAEIVEWPHGIDNNDETKGR